MKVRAALGGGVQRDLDLPFGRRVERTRRFVEHHDGRILQQGARDGKTLTLATRQRTPSFANARLQSVALPGDEVGRLREFERLRDLVGGGVRLADAQVFIDRSRKQHGLLKHDPDVGAKRGERIFANVDAVDRHAAMRGIEDAMQQAERRRFAGAGRADKGDGFAGTSGEETLCTASRLPS